MTGRQTLTAGFDRKSIVDEVDRLWKLPLPELRTKWEAVHPGVALPKGLSRDLLVRGIAWHLQCDQFGGLSPGAQQTLRKMARQLATSGTLDIERSVRPKLGTRIIREWRGKTYVVEATETGSAFEGQAFASLSHVARAITGTRWSGPRFFGLRPAAGHACDEDDR